MSEMVIVIAILGVLAGVVVLALQGAFQASQEALAIERVEMLNQGLHTWSTANRELYMPAMDSNAADEIEVLRALQFRNPNPVLASTGSPYIPPEYVPDPSSDENEFRIRWNGRAFELIRPGTAGTGLHMVFDGSDLGTPYTYPPGYSPVSR